MFVAPMSINQTLLQDINNEIVLAGSRQMLMYIIILENPTGFTLDQLRQARDRSKSILRNRHWHLKNYKPKDTRWHQEEIDFLMAKYGRMKPRNIGKILSRTPVACRDKFYREATPEQLEWVKEHGRYAGKINNFKK